ncbi:hypothetical protein Golax_023566, partial [Gossypium laxum]|nr:hypothetical protein [Gossypium laxum]
SPEPLNKELVGFDLGSEEFRFLELPDSSPFPVPLAFSKNGDKVLLFIAYKWCHSATRTDKFVWYDLESQRVEKVEIRGIPASFDVDLYVDSLVPLNTNDLMFYNEMPP